MSIIDDKSCRICLSPNSAFINVFAKFHDRFVKDIIENLTKIDVEVSRNLSVPSFICENCLSRLLSAESIIDLCRKNDKFLISLSEASIVEELETFEYSKEESIIQEENCQELELYEQETTWEPLMKLNEQVQSTRKKKEISTHFCSYCGRDFETRQKLLYHEKTKHHQVVTGQNLRPFCCDRCGHTFKSKSHIINHLNVVHLKIKRYQCNVCGFGMYSKSHYTSHVKTHANIREYICPQCNKAFARKETLNIHLKTHAGIKSYVCKHCGKAYSSHTDLKKHLFKHTNTRPYNCKLCSAGFFLKRLLFDHVKNHHSGIDTSSWLNGKTSWINIMN